MAAVNSAATCLRMLAHLVPDSNDQRVETIEEFEVSLVTHWSDEWREGEGERAQHRCTVAMAQLCLLLGERRGRERHRGKWRAQARVEGAWHP